MSTQTKQPDSQRAQWLSILAQTDPEQLDQAWQNITDKPEYRFLRKPETGMILVQARAGNTGKRFNFGEMTVSRCAVQTAGGQTGFGYVAGFRKQAAERIAVLDAMLQDPARYDELKTGYIDPMAQKIESQKDQVASRAGATKVNFFTMPRTRTGK